MQRIKIWIDADSCPRSVRHYVLKSAMRLGMCVSFVANRVIPADASTTSFEMIVCGNTEGAADDVIVENVACDDIVVTRDVPLAARLVERDVCVMNDRGTLFTRDNIKEKLADRDFDLQLARIGFGGSTAVTYGKKEITAFKKCFDDAVQGKMCKWRI